SLMLSGNFDALVDYKSLGEEMKMAVPSPDHFLPLLYILALKEDDEPMEFFNDRLVMGSLSMLSVKLG
ncbi:MAG: 4,5-DOPA dioxygenase extradiol, partial [Bacteroidales bacterium]